MLKVEELEQRNVPAVILMDGTLVLQGQFVTITGQQGNYAVTHDGVTESFTAVSVATFIADGDDVLANSSDLGILVLRTTGEIGISPSYSSVPPVVLAPALPSTPTSITETPTDGQSVVVDEDPVALIMMWLGLTNTNEEEPLTVTALPPSVVDEMFVAPMADEGSFFSSITPVSVISEGMTLPTTEEAELWNWIDPFLPVEE